MAVAPYKNKTALILGADTPAGAAAALKFSRIGARVILAGFDGDSLGLLMRLIADKRGEPLEAHFSKKGDVVAALCEKRKSWGHIHAVVNAVAACSFSGEERTAMFELSRRFNEVLYDLVKSVGNVRMATIWPDDAGDPPPVPAAYWHTMIRLSRIEGPSDENQEEGLKAAAVADTLLSLMTCEGGACPVEVRLEARRGKL